MPPPEASRLATSQLIDQLANGFYTIVPEQYKTYCSFTSKIIEQVLLHFGVPCRRVPCQIWYTKPDHIYVIGFLGKDNPGKWDGHVACCTEHVLIDAATHHFEREFGVPAPWVVATPLFEFPTTAIAQRTINPTDALWWHPPPEGIDTSFPDEPRELVDQYVSRLVDSLGGPKP